MSRKLLAVAVLVLAGVLVYNYLGAQTITLPAISANPNLSQTSSKVNAFATIHDPVNPNVARVTTANELVVSGLVTQPNATNDLTNQALATQDYTVRRLAEEQLLVQMEADANNLLAHEQSTSQQMGVEIR